MSFRKNISLPDEMYRQIKEYNEENPYNPIIVSKVAQAALNEVLNAKKSMKCN